MGIFGKKSGPIGLGKGVSSVSDDDARTAVSGGAATVVIDAPSTSTIRKDPEAAEASDIVDELSSSKPTRAQRRAAARVSKSNLDDAGNVIPGPRKSRKALKEEKAALTAAEDDQRPSNMVMIDFYPGMAKEDAIETARHWAMTHMDLPSMCFYYVHKIRDGYAVEVQEGVGKAYLPSVINLAQANPGRLIVVPMIRRKVTVFYSARLGEFEAQILPELQEPPAMPENPPLTASRSTSMTPVMKQYREWLVAGASTAVIGGLALVFSLGMYAFDSKAKVPPEWRTTDVAQLPVMQWGRLQADATDSYVVRMEFQDGQWRVVRQAVGASVEIARPDATNSGSGIEGGALPTTPGTQPNGTALPPPAPSGPTGSDVAAPGVIPPPAPAN